ncbi:hypothetical protein V5O48_008915 [Marasmius crinis-equi]|uniref:Uncharacterized protein n=1 Tax=Marasmius crinis-equi TaxID=585013 RepID=A0ABR3FCR5_9AGAR
MHFESALSLGLPPSPDNAPSTINIDRTCALISLENAAARGKYRLDERVQNEPEREIPRLHRIRNDPPLRNAKWNPRSKLTFSPFSSDSSSDESSPSTTSPCDSENKENVAPGFPAVYDGGDARDLHTQDVPNSISDFVESLRKSYGQETSYAHSSQQKSTTTNDLYPPSFPAHEQSLYWSFAPHTSIWRKEPLAELDPSTLPVQQRVVQRPAPAPAPSYETRFTNQVHPNAAPNLAPVNAYSFPDIPDIPELFPSYQNGPTAGYVAQPPIATAPSPPLQYNSDLGMASFVTATYPSEYVELHHRRIYPSSTSPDWCVGETIEYVPRRQLYPDEVVKPVIAFSTLEVAAPRPVGVNRYKDTQKWLQKLASDLAAD